MARPPGAQVPGPTASTATRIDLKPMDFFSPAGEKLPAVTPEQTVDALNALERSRQAPPTEQPGPAAPGIPTWTQRILEAAGLGATAVQQQFDLARRSAAAGMGTTLEAAGGASREFMEGLSEFFRPELNDKAQAMSKVVRGLVGIPGAVAGGTTAAMKPILDQILGPDWRQAEVADAPAGLASREIFGGQVARTPGEREQLHRPLTAEEALDIFGTLGIFAAGHAVVHPGAVEVYADISPGEAARTAEPAGRAPTVPQRAAAPSGAEVPVAARPPIGFGDFLERQGKRRGLTPADPDFVRLRGEYDRLGAPRYGTSKEPGEPLWHVVDLKTGEYAGEGYRNGAIAQMSANRMNEAALRERIDALRPQAAPPAAPPTVPPRVIGVEGLSEETRRKLVPMPPPKEVLGERNVLEVPERAPGVAVGTVLPEVPQRVQPSEPSEAQRTATAGQAEGELPKLYERAPEARPSPPTAMPEVRRPEVSGAPSGLQPAEAGRVVMPDVPRGTSPADIESAQRAELTQRGEEPKPGEAPPPPPEPPAEAPAGTPPAPPALSAGREQEIRVPAGARYRSHYEVVEGASLIPSHDPFSFAPRADYPEGVQNRPYHSDRAEQAKVIRQGQAGEFDPLFLLSPSPGSGGTPIIGPETNVVLSGNSRTMSLLRIARENPRDFERYRTEAERMAAVLNLDPEAIRKAQMPVVVRRLEGVPATPEFFRRFARETNEGFKQTLNTEAEAVSRGSALSADTVRRIASELDRRDLTLKEYLRAPGSGFTQQLIQDGVITAREVNRYIDSQTRLLNEDGRKLVERAILGSVVPDSDLLQRAPDAALDRIGRALGPLAQARSRGGDWDLSRLLVDALRTATEVRQRGMGSVADLRAQGSFLEGPIPDARADVLADALLGMKPTEFRAAADRYAGEAQRDVKGQRTMFGTPTTPAQAFSSAFGAVPEEAMLESRTPYRASVSGEAGGAMRTGPTSAPEGFQAVPSQLSAQTALPSDITRTRPPSITEGTPRTSASGAIGSLTPSGKTIWQPVNDVNALIRRAEEVRPDFERALQDLVASIEGTRFVGARVKTPEMVELKLVNRGVEPQSISDYLGARISLDDQPLSEQVRDALERQFGILEDENFFDRPKAGYEARHFLVRLPNGMTGEVQVSVHEIAEAQGEGHRPYSRLKTRPSAEETERAIAESEAIFDEARRRYRERLGQGRSGVAEVRQAYRPQIEATRQPSAPPFYSQAERAIEQKMPVRAPAAQVRGILASAGVKPDEMKWAGLDDWIAEKARAGQPVTKQEALDFIRQNQVRVEEVVKSERAVEVADLQERLDALEAQRRAIDTEARALAGVPVSRPSLDFRNRTDEQQRRIDRIDAEAERLGGLLERTQRKESAVKFSRYTQPGGQNYRELLLTWGHPPKGETVGEAAQRLGIAPEHIIPGHENTQMAYRSPHFDEPNVLAHVRFNDRTDAEGRRVLFIEELQSDWHQEGRRKGYKEEDLTQQNYATWGDARGMSRADVGATWKTDDPRFLEWQDEQRRAFENVNRPPSAPFAKTWHELAFKRILRWAAENGYDRVGWTTGAMQANRYDLSKQVKAVEWAPRMGSVRVEMPNGAYQFIKENGVTEKNLESYVGKDAARHLIEQGPSPDLWRRIEGDDLKVGGEGMRGFYDKILPEFANRYGKKWGARVGEIQIQTDKGAAYSVVPMGEMWGIQDRHGILIDQLASRARADAEAGDLNKKATSERAHALDITPAMKHSVLEEGQALFEPRRAMNLPAGQTVPEPEWSRKAAQLELVYPERPDAGPEAKPLAAQALRDLDAARVRVSSAGGTLGRRGEEAGSGVRTLGVGINAELRHKGRVDLRGRLADTAEEVAQILQVARDPRYETVRFIYVDEAGRVVGHEAITSRLPGAASAYLELPREEISSRLLAGETLGPRELPRPFWEMQDRMRRLNATGYWISHNHPSGSVIPSRGDQGLTKIFASAVPGFKGHVVIDHGEYAVIERGPETPYNRTGFVVRHETLKGVAQPDPLLSPRPVRGILAGVFGHSINAPSDVAGIATSLRTPKDWIALLYRSSNGLVRAVQEMPKALFTRPDEAANYIRGRQREFGAPETYAWMERVTLPVMRAAEGLAERGALNDLVYNDAAPGARGSGSALAGRGIVFRPPERIPAIRVEEERRPPIGETGERPPEKGRQEPERMPDMPDEVLTAPQLRIGLHRVAVKAAERVFLEAGVERDSIQYPVLSDQILDMMREGRIELPALERTLRAEGLDLAQFGEHLFRPAVRDAARRLQALSVLERKLNSLAAEIDRASTPEEKQKRAEELGRTLKLTREIDTGFKLKSLLQRLDNVRRGLLVSQLATAVRNFEQQVGRVGLDVADTAIQRTLEKWFNKGVRGPNPAEVFGEIADIFRQVGNTGARERIRSEVDRFLAQWPRQYDRFYGQWSSDVASAARDQHIVLRGADAAFQKAERMVEILNWANRLQEYAVRRAVFQTEMAYQLRRVGLDPIEVFGGKRKLTEAEQARLQPATKAAVEKALEMTYANSPAHDSIGWHFIRIINKMPFLATSVIPFPRFMAVSLRFLYEFSPTGLLQLTSPVEREAMRNGNYQVISRAALGSAILLTSYAIREMQPDDNRWYEISVPGMARPVDVRPFNPFATYLFVAELAKRKRKGTLYTLDHKDLLSGLLSANIRAGTTNYLVDTVLRDVTQFADPDRFKRAWATAAGQVASGFLTPLQQVQDVLGQFDEHVRTIKETQSEPFLGPIKAKIPVVSETLPQAYRPTREEPYRREEPLLRQALGMTLTSEKNALERELDRLQFQPQEIFHSTGEPLIDNRAKQLMGEAVERRLVPRIESDFYQSKTDAQKGEWLREHLHGIRAGIMMRAEHQLLRDARAEGPEQVQEVKDAIRRLHERRRPKREELARKERQQGIGGEGPDLGTEPFTILAPEPSGAQ